MPEQNDLIALTIEVVSSFVGQNNLRASEVPDLIASVHASIAALEAPAEPEPTVEPEPTKPEAATTARKSLSNPDVIISMIDGKPYKTLKRHLGRHGLTPAQYRERYGLKADYPMVAANYSQARKDMAQKLGLGRKPGQSPKADEAAPVTEAPKPTGAKRGRKPKMTGQEALASIRDGASSGDQLESGPDA